MKILKSATYSVHTHKHKRLCQYKWAQQFQILMTFKCQWPKYKVIVTPKKTPAWFNLDCNAYAPTYGNLSLSSEQLTGDMASFDHFTEAFINYSFYYYSIPEQLYAWLSPAQTTNHFFLQLHIPNPHGPNHLLSITKLPDINSDLL
jgi:hypothetical protein